MSYKEAVANPAWVKSMQLKIKALENNNTWSIVDLPPGKEPIEYRWIYRIKYLASGHAERFNSRLVTKGFNKKEG